MQNHGDLYPHHLQPLLPQTSQCDIDKFHRARSFLPGSLTNDPALVTFTRNTGLTKGIVPCAVVEIVIDCGSGNGSIKDNVLHQKDSTCWASKFFFSAPLLANCWQWAGWCGSTINNTSPNRSSEKRRIKVVHKRTAKTLVVPAIWCNYFQPKGGVSRTAMTTKYLLLLAAIIFFFHALQE